MRARTDHVWVAVRASQVGSGKSSLLAALLGELQPLRAAAGATPHVAAGSGDTGTGASGEVGAAAAGASGVGLDLTAAEAAARGPVLVGRVAYCSQVRRPSVKGEAGAAPASPILRVESLLALPRGSGGPVGGHVHERVRARVAWRACGRSRTDGCRRCRGSWRAACGRTLCSTTPGTRLGGLSERKPVLPSRCEPPVEHMGSCVTSRAAAASQGVGALSSAACVCVCLCVCVCVWVVTRAGTTGSWWRAALRRTWRGCPRATPRSSASAA
jgi:hypothetical protein